MLKKLSLVTICLMFAFQSQAMIMFSPSVTYMEQKENNNNAESDIKLTVIDLRLGYVMDMGLYLGGLYSVQDHDLLTDSSDSFFGPSIGYYNSGFSVIGTYYLYGEKDLSNGTGKLSKVSGFQVDLGYAVPITPTVLIGPQLTYFTYEFDEIEVGGFAGPNEYKLSGLHPYFNLTFLF